MKLPTGHAMRAAAACVALVLSACANLGPGIVPPTLTGIGVRLDRVERAQAMFAVLVELANPNAVDLDLTGLDAIVTIEDQRVAAAALAAPVRIPARGTAQAEVVASTGMDAILRATAAAMLRGATTPPGRAPSLRYAITGEAIIGGRVRVPFTRRGEVGHEDAQ